MEGSRSAHLSDNTRRTLEVLTQANSPQNVGLVKAGLLKGRTIGIVETHSPADSAKVAKKVATAFAELDQLTRDGAKLSGPDRQLVDHLLKKVRDPTSALHQMTSRVSETLKDKKTFGDHLARLMLKAEANRNLLVREEAAQRNVSSSAATKEHFAVPHAGVVERNINAIKGALLASQSVEDYRTQALLYPRISDPTSATRSYPLRMAANIAPGGSLGSHAQVFMQRQLPVVVTAALAKPIDKGLDVIESKNWGLRVGQDSLNENMASYLKHTMGLPTRNPDAALGNLSHALFGPINVDSQRLLGLGIPIGDHQCLEILGNLQRRGALTKENFQTELENAAYHYLSHQAVPSRLGAIPDKLSLDALNEILKNSDTIDQVVAKLVTQVYGEAVTNDSNNFRAKANAAMRACSSLIPKNADAAKPVKNGSELPEIRSLAGSVYDRLTDPKVVPVSKLCSVQAWEPGCTTMLSLSPEALAAVPSLALGRIQLLDAMVVGRDRNATNILCQQVTQQDLFARIDKQLPGLGTFIGERGANLIKGEVPYLGTKEESQMITTIAEELLTAWEAQNGAIPNSQMQLEWDVHLAVTAQLRQTEVITDLIPIDNAIILPDPKLGAKASCLETEGYNEWIKQPQARTGTLPPRTAAHLASIDLRRDVLPGLVQEYSRMRELAGKNHAGNITFNADQQKLWLVSSRIEQIGAREGKSFFEMGLMKDSMFLTDNMKHFYLWKAPLSKLLTEHAGDNVTVEKINLSKLDKAIMAAFQEIESRYGPRN